MREFKRVVCLGLDMYVDFDRELTGNKLLSVKCMHSGRSVKYDGVLIDGQKMEDVLRDLCGLEVKSARVEDIRVEDIKVVKDLPAPIKPATSQVIKNK